MRFRAAMGMRSRFLDKVRDRPRGNVFAFVWGSLLRAATSQA